jgi:hypothetical protein
LVGPPFPPFPPCESFPRDASVMAAQAFSVERPRDLPRRLALPARSLDALAEHALFERYAAEPRSLVPSELRAEPNSLARFARLPVVVAAASAAGAEPAQSVMHARFRRSVSCRSGTTKAGPSMIAEPGFRGSGDAGIRTRVRLPIPRSIYVRIHPFCSPRSLIGRVEAHREPAVQVSPAASRRRAQASQNLATPGGPPQAGLTDGWEVRSPEGRLLTQPERSYRSQVHISRRFYECSEHLGTPPRLHRTRRNLSSP